MLKDVQPLPQTFLAHGKKFASNTYHLCLATPAEMRSLEAWERSLKIPEMINYSCTPLHMWICSMEFLFHLAMKLLKGNACQPLTSNDCQLTKLKLKVMYLMMFSLMGPFHENSSSYCKLMIHYYLKTKFWQQLNIRLFVLKPGQGSSNNDNTACIF
jgi:hypothetical protein